MGLTNGIIASQNDWFTLEVQADGVYLTVAADEAHAGGENTIVAELQRLHISDYDLPRIRQLVRNRDGQTVKIADPPPPLVDPEIRVLVSRDRMEAMVQVTLPKHSRPVTIELLADKLAAGGVVYGVDQDALARACKHTGVDAVVARGLRPVDGTDGYIRYAVDTENKVKLTEQADGRVDFKNIRLFTLVDQGQILGEKIPPTAGAMGKDVLGNDVVQRPGREAPLVVGKNVVLAENYLLAGAAGRLELENNRLQVLSVLEIKEDVDLSTGNIEFAGDVIIRGSVQQGMTVKAQGDVEICGIIGGGTVEGRNIMVRRGIHGMNSGYVKATGNIVTQFVENAVVHAGKNVCARDVILHSRITAGGEVVVEGRGVIAGGSVRAGELIRMKQGGTKMAVATELEVGVDPVLREEYQNLQRDMKQKGSTLEQAQKALTLLRAMDQQQLSPDKKEMLLKLTKAQFNLAGQLEQMKRRSEELEQQIEQMQAGQIIFQDRVFPGVKMIMGNSLYPVREEMRAVSFRREHGDIRPSYQWK